MMVCQMAGGEQMLCFSSHNLIQYYSVKLEQVQKRAVRMIEGLEMSYIEEFMELNNLFTMNSDAQNLYYFYK